MSAIPVRVDHVSKRFDKTVALDDVSLDIGEGEIFALLGPNGAGKTTLIRTILDIIKPDAGRVEIFGRPFRPEDRNRLGYLPEERGLYAREEAAAVLEYLGGLKGLSPAQARTDTAYWLERFGLVDAAKKRVEQLSKGNQQKLQIASALLARPAVAILDEPLSGLDPMSARLVNAVIREYAAAGMTVVLSTHQMALVETLCTRVLMIARGHAVLYGTLEEIKRRHSSHAVRVVSTADYAACALVARVEADASDGHSAQVHLNATANADEFLAWLVTHGAHVDRFERVSTPLEDIFVAVAEGIARVS